MTLRRDFVLLPMSLTGLSGTSPITGPGMANSLSTPRILKHASKFEKSKIFTSSEGQVLRYETPTTWRNASILNGEIYTRWHWDHDLIRS